MARSWVLRKGRLAVGSGSSPPGVSEIDRDQQLSIIGVSIDKVFC